jgi:hypothetical protein
MPPGRSDVRGEGAAAGRRLEQRATANVVATQAAAGCKATSKMKIKKIKAWMAASAVVLGVGGLTATAEAAPIGNLQVTDEGAGRIDSVAQRCWWYRGTRHCRWYGYQPRYRQYGYPENYRTGSRRWWEEMDREDRGGRG